MKSEQINELASALAKAQAEFSAVPKESKNPFFKSTYAALPEVVKTATPVLTKYGLSISQFIGQAEDGTDALTTYLLHSSGQFIAHTMKLHLIKDDPQAQGSAVTYARRYSYMAALGLVADVDDDGNAASNPPYAQKFSAPLPAPHSERPKASSTETASPAQLKALSTILKRQSKDGVAEAKARWSKAPEELTKAEASTWIDELNTKAVPDGHEPF
jgi:hypothetical protein